MWVWCTIMGLIHVFGVQVWYAISPYFKCVSVMIITFSVIFWVCKNIILCMHRLAQILQQVILKESIKLLHSNSVEICHCTWCTIKTKRSWPDKSSLEPCRCTCLLCDIFFELINSHTHLVKRVSESSSFVVRNNAAYWRIKPPTFPAKQPGTKKESRQMVEIVKNEAIDCEDCLLQCQEMLERNLKSKRDCNVFFDELSYSNQYRLK